MSISNDLNAANLIKHANIYPSASLILMSTEQTPHVLLLKRSSKASFMPNALVFPGGHVDIADSQLIQMELSLSTSDQEWQAWGCESKQQFVQSLYTALRETWEESGLLPHLGKKKLLTHLTQNLTHHVLKQQQLRVHTIRCVGQWLTPDHFKKRFHTFFWMALCHRNEHLKVDGEEISTAQWWAPKQALQAYTRGIIELAPPTIRILYDLAYHEVLQTAPYAHAICPQVSKSKDQTFILFPGDIDYLLQTQQEHPYQHQAHITRYNRLVLDTDQRWRLLIE